jgi:hypothetical protein
MNEFLGRKGSREEERPSLIYTLEKVLEKCFYRNQILG